MSQLVLPTPEQVEWANRELGVIIHFDPTTYRDNYDYMAHMSAGEAIPAADFAPDKLSVDQWIASAKAMGAGYAVLVAKHCTGFALWPTEYNDYNVMSSPVKRDIVSDFIAACREHDVKPGLYYSASFNQYMGIGNPGVPLVPGPGKQEAYNEMVIGQLTELWTRYGELFEIWFDGGVLPLESGGPDIAPLLNRLQPNAVVFQGPKGCRSLLRWVGNERGEASEDCSAIFKFTRQGFDGTEECLNAGDADGDTWCPAESDLPNRRAGESSYGGWFWSPDQEGAIVSGEALFDTYLHSVGRNTNMLVGMAINRDGLFSEPDAAAFAEFARLRERAFGAPLAAIAPKAGEISLSLSAANPRYAVISEDIALGERVAGYDVAVYGEDGALLSREERKVIGHKRIFALPAGAREVAVTVNAYRAQPRITSFALY